MTGQDRDAAEPDVPDVMDVMEMFDADAGTGA
jgi:hypothetical protein